MRRKFFGILIILSATLLAGCTTPEVRNNEIVKDDLTFYSETTTPKQSVTQEKTPPPPVPPTPPQDNRVTNKKMYTTPPQMLIDLDKQYTATLKTDAGDIVVALNAEDTPITVNNFVFLAREKFYDNTIFHRTIANFMIQGGDPDGTGRGGPGYTFEDEPFEGKYTRGIMAMANAGPNTNGSQFFIMHKDNNLAPDYVIFGEVTSGLDVVDNIATAPIKPGGEKSSPVTPIHVRTIIITET